MAKIPEPRDTDADDVSLALEVAQSQWARGDYGEAIKWLRKAADSAFDAEDDQRGMELSKIAAELKTEIDRHIQRQKPSALPPVPPKAAPTVPPRVDVPPPRSSQHSAVTEKSTSGFGTTGTRKRTSPSRPFVDDDEATREYRVGDFPSEIDGSAILDEWPTETLDGVEEIEEISVIKSPTVKKQRSAPKKTVQNKKRELLVPFTRSIRVAVGARNDGVYVRLLDSQGLREGEHDAMLVALTSTGDIRELFK
jgi:hypothetical protein